MKSVRIPCAALAVLLLLALVNSAAVERRCARWIDLAQSADEAAVREEWSRADELLETLQNELDDCRLWLCVVLSHSGPDEARAAVRQARLAGSLHQGVHMRCALAQLQDILERTASGERFSLGNIL